MKILYMARIYGLVTEIRKNNLKKITAVFTKNCCKIILKKKIYSDFYGKPLQKPFYSHINKKIYSCKRSYLQRFLVKNRCKIVFCSGCYIRTAVNNLQWFLTKLLLKFAALPIIAVVQPLLTEGNNRCKSPFLV
jgi:hypothetical protein